MKERIFEFAYFMQDRVILSENKKEVQEMLEDLYYKSMHYGIKIKEGKTKCKTMDIKIGNINIRVENEEVEQVNVNKYLVSIVTKDIKYLYEI